MKKINVKSKWLKDKNILFILKNFKILSTANKHKIKKFTEDCLKKNIPFGDFNIAFDYLAYKLKCNTKKLERNREILAKLYIKHNLKQDLKFFNDELDFYKKVITKEENELFNVHIHWFVDFIKAILYKKSFPNLEPKKCKINSFFAKSKLNLDEKDYIYFNKLHNEIHLLAKELKQLYNEEEYYYFKTLFSELRSVSITLREVIGNIFLKSKLISIYIDPITKVNNRLKFLEDINSYQNKTIMLLNIKNFSQLNLTYGTKFGDKTLQVVAKNLEKFEILNIYRIYADEFAIIVKDNKSAEYLFNSIDEKMKLDDIDYIISFYGSFRKINIHSFEICEYALLKGKKQHLINANNLKYENISIYKSNLDIIQKIKVALLTDKVKVYKQPIYDIKQEKITKYECLMRIEDENGTILNPGSFMEVLEQMALYEEYTKTMIYKSFKYFKDKNYEFSINFSMSDIQNYNTIQFLKKMISNYPYTAKRCTIELLENEAVKNFDLVNNFFREIKEVGIKTALDDFGSGYSNFAYIFSLELDYIKIDGSITKKLLEDKKMRILLETMVKMAHSIGMKVIAEFVSDKKLLEYVKKANVDYAQGYYISEPKEEI